VTRPGAVPGPAGRRQGTAPPAVDTIVPIEGALDADAAVALRELLAGLLQPPIKVLILDLSLVSSCDSAGLAVLIGAERRARVLGIAMRLAAPSVPVMRLLRLTGLDHNLTICPDLRGALTAERREPANAYPQDPAEDVAARDQDRTRPSQRA
jgi:anti-anti-sigma factor